MAKWLILVKKQLIAIKRIYMNLIQIRLFILTLLSIVPYGAVQPAYPESTRALGIAGSVVAGLPNTGFFNNRYMPKPHDFRGIVQVTKNLKEGRFPQFLRNQSSPKPDVQKSEDFSAQEQPKVPVESLRALGIAGSVVAGWPNAGFFSKQYMPKPHDFRGIDEVTQNLNRHKFPEFLSNQSIPKPDMQNRTEQPNVPVDSLKEDVVSDTQAAQNLADSKMQNSNTEIKEADEVNPNQSPEDESLVGSFLWIQTSQDELRAASSVNVGDSYIFVDPLSELKDRCSQLSTGLKSAFPNFMTISQKEPLDRQLQDRQKSIEAAVEQLNAVIEDIRKLVPTISAEVKKDLTEECSKLNGKVQSLMNSLTNAVNLIAESDTALLEQMGASFTHLVDLGIDPKNIYTGLGFEGVPSFDVLMDKFQQLENLYSASTPEGSRYRQMKFTLGDELAYASYNAWRTQKEENIAMFRIGTEQAALAVMDMVARIQETKISLAELDNDLKRLKV
jgi:hypothetical protein